MRILPFIILFTCCLFNKSSQAQCRVSVDAPDTLAFLISINDIIINTYPVVSLEFNLNTSGKTNFKAEFPDRPMLNFSQVITIKKGAAVAYSIDRSKGALKFILTSESLQAVTEKPAQEGFTQEIPTDTLQPLAIHNGCYPITDDSAYQDMITACDEQHFEAKKLNLMAEFAVRSCLRTDQLRYMMSKLSQEDNKLALLIAAKGHIYDTERLLEVSADFFLARNKAKVAEIVADDREP